VLWIFLSFCFGPVSEEKIPENEQPSIIKKLLSDENPPIDLIKPPNEVEEEEICNFVSQNIRYKAKFIPLIAKFGKKESLWVWKQKNKYWCEYDKDQSSMIEEHYHNYLLDCEKGMPDDSKQYIISGKSLALAPKGYKIDFKKEIQVNIATKSERSIKREERVVRIKLILWLAAIHRAEKFLTILINKASSEKVHNTLKEVKELCGEIF